MTSTTTITAPATDTAAAHVGTRRNLWRTGAVAGIAASLAVTAFAAAARSIDVPLSVGGKSIPLVGFAQLTLIASILGTVLAVVLSRRAQRPRHSFLVTTVGLTAVTFIPDVLADAHTATKVALVLTHLVVAAMVIPALATRLAD